MWNKFVSWFLHGVLNWKTSGAALIGGTATILGALHVVTITPEQQATIFAATVIIVGWFAKDGNVAGVLDETVDGK